jgi:hypothetical protein
MPAKKRTVRTAQKPLEFDDPAVDALLHPEPPPIPQPPPVYATPQVRARVRRYVDARPSAKQHLHDMLGKMSDQELFTITSLMGVYLHDPEGTAYLRSLCVRVATRAADSINGVKR